MIPDNDSLLKVPKSFQMKVRSELESLSRRERSRSVRFLRCFRKELISPWKLEQPAKLTTSRDCERFLKTCGTFEEKALYEGTETTEDWSF